MFESNVNDILKVIHFEVISCSVLDQNAQRNPCAFGMWRPNKHGGAKSIFANVCLVTLLIVQCSVKCECTITDNGTRLSFLNTIKSIRC